MVSSFTSVGAPLTFRSSTGVALVIVIVVVVDVVVDVCDLPYSSDTLYVVNDGIIIRRRRRNKAYTVFDDVLRCQS